MQIGFLSINSSMLVNTPASGLQVLCPYIFCYASMTCSVSVLPALSVLNPWGHKSIHQYVLHLVSVQVLLWLWEYLMRSIQWCSSSCLNTCVQILRKDAVTSSLSPYFAPFDSDKYSDACSLSIHFLQHFSFHFHFRSFFLLSGKQIGMSTGSVDLFV